MLPNIQTIFGIHQVIRCSLPRNIIIEPDLEVELPTKFNTIASVKEYQLQIQRPDINPPLVLTPAVQFQSGYLVQNQDNLWLYLFKNLANYQQVILDFIALNQQSEIAYSQAEYTQISKRASQNVAIKTRPVYAYLSYSVLRYGGLIGKTGGYAVSYRPRGPRKFLMTDSTGLWLCYPDSNEYNLVLRQKDFPFNIILDGLLVEERTVESPNTQYFYLIMDVIYLNGPMRASRLADRLQTVIDLQLPQLLDQELILPVVRSYDAFNTPEEFFIKMRKMLDSQTLYKDPGLLFYPVDRPYARLQAYEWYQHPSLDLEVINGKLTVMCGSDYCEFIGSKYQPVDPDVDLDDGLYQFEYLDNQLVMDHPRLDRHLPNTLEKALEIWNGMVDPITPEVLKGESDRLMKKYHSRARTQMYRDLGTKRLLVVHPDRGADAHHWGQFDQVDLWGPSIREGSDSEELLRRIRINQLENVRVVDQLGHYDAMVLYRVTTDQAIEFAQYLSQNGVFVYFGINGDSLMDQMRPPLQPKKETSFRLGGMEFRAINSEEYQKNGALEPLCRVGDLICQLSQDGFSLEQSYNLDRETFLPETDKIYTRFFGILRMIRQSKTVCRSELPDIVYPGKVKPLEKPKYPALIRPIGDLPVIEYSGGDFHIVEEPVWELSMLSVGQFQVFDKMRGLSRLGVYGDGSCFFHAFLLGTSEEYRASKNPGKFAREYRYQLADQLGQVEDGLTKYDEMPELKVLYDQGQKIRTNNQTFDYSLEGLQRLLRSSCYVGDEIIGLVAKLTGIDIWVFQARSYGLVPLIQTTQRASWTVMILFLEDHFELLAQLIGQSNPPQKFKLMFARGNAVLKVLASR